MKRIPLAILVFIMLSGAAHAQTYSIDWHKISGGGAGADSNAVYSLTGSIGQQDAGIATNSGVYSITGGFEAVFAIETPGAPVLSLNLTATNSVIVSWPSPSSGFNLQATSDLNSTNWAAASQTVTDTGAVKYIIVNPTSGSLFFRLKSP
jgi:hypothetical protein